MEEPENGVEVEETLPKTSSGEPLPAKSDQEGGFAPVSEPSGSEVEVVPVGTGSAAKAEYVINRMEAEENLPKTSSGEPLPAIATQEGGFTSLSEPSDPEPEDLPVRTISAPNSEDLKVASPLSEPVQTIRVMDETDVPSLAEGDISRSSTLEQALGEPDTTAMETDSHTPVDNGSRSFPIQTSDDLRTPVHAQNVESREKMDVVDTAHVPPAKLACDRTPMDTKAEVEPNASHGPVHLEGKQPTVKLSEPAVTATLPTSPLDSSGKWNAPEKIGKRGPEVESIPERLAKRNKKSDGLFSVPDAVEAVLSSTAEIVVVLAGMAQLRAGRPFTSLEKDLAAVAYQNVVTLVSKVAPNVLVSKDALETMIHDLNMKRMAQTRKEDEARAKALAEAEAKAKAEKDEAEAKLKAEEQAKLKAKAEAEEREQAALRAAAAVALGPVKDAKPVAVLPPPSTPPGQPAQALPPPLEPKISSASPIIPPSTMSAQAEDITQLEATSERKARENSPSQQSSKNPLGRPPKVRSKPKKESSVPTLTSPDYLDSIQSSVPEAQRPQVTHKQLCIAVQQFIQEQMPHASQIPEAIPPSYINASTPCQICKLISKETTTVIVCDSCDKLFHLKCIQSNSHTKGVRKGDWHCAECLSGGRSYREKYGSYQPGSNNGVKLWAPHDTSEDNNVVISGLGAGACDGRNGSVSSLTQQGTLTVDVERGSDTIKDERITGNFGGSPHLIVHLVNEPSPRTEQPPQHSSVIHGGGHNKGGNLPSGSELKSTSRADSGDSRSMTEASGSAKRSSRDSEGASNGNARARGSEVVSSEKAAAEQLDASNDGNPPGKHVEVPLLMEWVGDSISSIEGKTYYKSCRVGGHTYHLADCALFRPETPDVPPYIARLQALWEDLSTSHKWVRVSWCYYPSDIPITMGRPGRVEPDEVYESNHCDNNLVFMKPFHLCSFRGGYTTPRKGSSNLSTSNFVSESTSQCR
ncbi:hypothetical protein R1sor_006763 [Riccia sorocarpa]|uniref:PHD finger protein n=1 Tax=Riccia sorocarpa TaxID=122646 RepID=A0ABD3HRC9_9MARC